jgi:hypothetical protein
VRKGKHDGGEDDRDGTAELPFEAELKISAKPSLSMSGETKEPMRIMSATVIRG